MKVHFKDIHLSTNKFELVDITGRADGVLEKSNVENGVCAVFAPHAAAAITVNEHEAGLMKDVLALV